MTNIWLLEYCGKGREEWKGYCARIDYEKAIKEVRWYNRKERKRGHLIKYRIRKISLAENVKVVK